MLSVFLAKSTDAQNNDVSRTAWFEDARFGMFISWNACATLEGRYCGEPIRQGVYGEWLRARNRVSRADWDKAYEMMTITPEKVDEWAESAKQAGMKYIIFVAKHHDGLAFWPSKVSGYTFNRLSDVSFDVIGRLKEACDKRGLKLCLYYSQWQDWEDPNGWGNFWEFNSKDQKQFEEYDNFQFWDGSLFRDNLTADQFGKYWYGKAMPQVEELIRNYHPAIIWFDCYIPPKSAIMTDKQLDDMKAMIRKLDPTCLINSRLPSEKIGGVDGVDYETLGDNQFPHQRIGHPWESVVTFSKSWAYNRDDLNWRSTTYFIRNLVRNVSLGGNMAINIGPLSDGAIPDEALVRLHEIGRSLSANKEGIAGCGYTPFEENTQDWGLTTVGRHKDGTNLLYLHVFDWPTDGVIRVNGLKSKVRKAYFPATGTTLQFAQNGKSVHINAKNISMQPYETVIRLDLDSEVEVDNTSIGERNGGDIVMQSTDADIAGVKLEIPDEGSTKLKYQLSGWEAADASASWRITIPAVGKYRVRICYAASINNEGKEFVVSTGNGMELRASTVGTHINWGEFRTFDMGSFDFEENGDQTITVRPSGKQSGELFKLLWVCCSPE